MQAVGVSELTKINPHGGQLMFHLNVPNIQVNPILLLIYIIFIYNIDFISERDDSKMAAQQMRLVLQAFLNSCHEHYVMYIIMVNFVLAFVVESFLSTLSCQYWCQWWRRSQYLNRIGWKTRLHWSWVTRIVESTLPLPSHEEALPPEISLKETLVHPKNKYAWLLWLLD